MVPNPPPLPVVVVVDEAPSPWWPPSPLGVNLWSLVTACCLAAIHLAYWHDSSGGDRATRALVCGMLCCSLLQAAAAALALALLLTRRYRRSRWALGLLAVAAGAAAHCMYGGFVGIAIAAHPRDVVVLAVVGVTGLFLMAASDLIAFLSLLLGQEEDEEEN